MSDPQYDMHREVIVPISHEDAYALRPHLTPAMGSARVSSEGLKQLLGSEMAPFLRTAMRTIEKDRRERCVTAQPVEWELSFQPDVRAYVLCGRYVGRSHPP